MSQKPPASRPASHSPPAPQRITLPPFPRRADAQHGGRELAGSQLESGEGYGFPQTLPPSTQAGRTTPIGDSWRTPGPPRNLGVHSMLNPSEPGPHAPPSDAMGSTAPDSPASAIGSTSQFAPSPSTVTSYTFPGQPPHSGTPPATEDYGSTLHKVRKILTARSPSRSLSLSRGAPRATIDAQQSPFLTTRGRPYAAEPGPASDIPPMPTPPANLQQQYGIPSEASTPSIERRLSGGPMHAPGQAPPSQSASPSISASSHNPPSSQTSPASFPFPKASEALQTNTPYYPGSSFAASIPQGGGMQFRGTSAVPEGPYSAQAPSQSQGPSSAGSSRQTSASDPIQVLTITTSQGQYTMPVDVHQASRLADEKRARNAGASARFRQRRKEKEKEASSSIEKLNQQTRDLERRLRDTEQERDFYCRERDRFRDIVFRNPETRHLAAQAPPSPLGMRPASFSVPMQQMGGPAPPPPSGPPIGYQPAATISERAPRRRRTDMHGDFTDVPYSHPPTSTLPPVQAPGFATGPGTAPPNLPPLRIENTTVPPRTTASMASSATHEAPQQQPYGSFARSPFERSWPGDAGRR